MSSATKISTRKINEIAKATKEYCHKEGLGQCINVFSNGDWLFGHSENDVIARGDGNGGWDHRIACLRTPMTRAQVAEYLSN
jgi:hypothetical protein